MTGVVTGQLLMNPNYTGHVKMAIMAQNGDHDGSRNGVLWGDLAVESWFSCQQEPLVEFIRSPLCRLELAVFGRVLSHDRYLEAARLVAAASGDR